MTFRITESFVARTTSYDRFAKLQNDIIVCDEENIVLSLDIKNRFGLTFVFLFSSILFLSQKHQKNISVFCNEKSFHLFKKIGLLPKKIDFDSRRDYAPCLLENVNIINEDKDIFKTVTEITREAPVKMSPELSALFISKAGEMFNNAIEHSGGLVLGVKYFKNQKSTYCFSCYDTGVGIPQKVMASKMEITDQMTAFKWAMVNGNSTVSTDIPRGLGLGLLHSFAKANSGAIRICSGRVLYTYDKSHGEIYHELKNNFVGTLFEMDIIADNNHKYILK